MTSELDSSNYGSYAWMTAHHKQFGTEVVAMTGPAGFLAYGTTFSGYLSTARFMGDLLLKSAFAFLALCLAAQVSGIRRWAWLGLIIIFLPNVGDLFYDFAILAGALQLLAGKQRARLDLVTVVAAALLGFMGLMKGTNALVAGAAVAAVILQGFLDRKPKRALLIGAIAVIVFLAGWLSARQSLGHIPAYFRGVWELATGYNETMGLGSSSRELIAGLVLAAGLALISISGAWSARRDVPSLLTICFLAGFSFLKWKHGFLRADGHVYIFFNYAVLVLPAFWLVEQSSRSTRGWSWTVMLIATLGTLICGSIAASEFRWTRFATMLGDAPRHFSAHISYFLAPEKNHRAREQELSQHRIEADLPQVRAEVGEAPIDFFGYEQGVLLLNGLNYQPRPMGGGTFNVFTRYLQEKNEAFIRDPRRRPEFQLVKLQTLDDRLPAADDPLTLTALLQLYTPVRAQRGFLLFRSQEPKEAPSPTVLRSMTIHPGEPVNVPSITNRELLLFSIEAPYSVAGRMRDFIYRPPQLTIEVLANDRSGAHIFRLAPSLADVPVILSPLLETNRDLLGLYGAGIPRHVSQITFRAANADEFARDFEITFYKLPALAVPDDDLAKELLTYFENPLSNRSPIEVATQETGIHELYGEPITLVHAPGQLTFPLQANDQQVIFNYGLMPQAYDPGRTKGVEFRVESIGTDGELTTLFSRLLEPLTRMGDRGMQWARVFLPPAVSTGARLRLRTNLGPAGDGAWAQSYFTHVQIKTGPIDPRQFSGFPVQPLPPGFAGHDELVPYGRKARAFPPPSALAFPIPAGARQVTIAAGIQQAAYEGENQTNGIEILVSVEAAGRDSQLLAHRYLNPRQRPLDRGTQVFVVSLPPTLSADARLVVRAGPGPSSDDRWDWGYLETVYFR